MEATVGNPIDHVDFIAAIYLQDDSHARGLVVNRVWRGTIFQRPVRFALTHIRTAAFPRLQGLEERRRMER